MIGQMLKMSTWLAKKQYLLDDTKITMFQLIAYDNFLMSNVADS